MHRSKFFKAATSFGTWCVAGMAIVQGAHANEEKKAEPAADAHGSPAADVAVGAKAVWKRRFVIPDLEVEPVPGRAPVAPWKPGEARFAVFAVLASWNKPSAELIPWLNALARGELARRKVRVLAAFSQDTVPSVLRFVKETHPVFDLGLAPLSLVKVLSNPRVPTVWIVNNRGEILTRQQAPDEAERKRLEAALLRWTDF